MKKSLLMTMVAVVALNFTACFKGKMPECDDERVKETLTKEIKGYALLGAGFMALFLGDSKASVREVEKNMNVSFDSFLTTNSDTKLKKVSCKARATMTFGGQNLFSDFIHYNAQITNDGQVYVEILDK